MPEYDYREFRIVPYFGTTNWKVANDGSVWTFKKGYKADKRCQPKWRELKPWLSTHGYLQISFCHQKAVKRIEIHRLVCEIFHGPPPDTEDQKMEARHLDGDKLNNWANNLAWGTSKQNTEDAIRHGTMKRGIQLPQAILTEELVFQMRKELLEGITISEIARSRNLKYITVYDAIRGKKKWKHVPFPSLETASA